MATIVLSSDDEDDCIILDEDERIHSRHVDLEPENDFLKKLLEDDKSEHNENSSCCNIDPLQNNSSLHSMVHKESEQMYFPSPKTMQEEMRILDDTCLTDSSNKTRESLFNEATCDSDGFHRNFDSPTSSRPISKQDNNVVLQRLAAALTTALSSALPSLDDKQNSIYSNPDKSVTNEKSVEALVNKESETIKKRLRGRPPNHLRSTKLDGYFLRNNKRNQVTNYIFEDYYEDVAENSIAVKEKCRIKRRKLSKNNPDKIVTNEESAETMVNKETETIKKRRGRPPKLRNTQKEVMSNNNNPNMEQILIENSKLNDDICESTSDLKIIQYFSIDDAKNSSTVGSECTSVFQGNVNENINDNSGHSYEALVENSIAVKEKCGIKRRKPSKTNPDKIVSNEESAEIIANKETETITKRRGRPPKLKNTQKEVMSNNINPNMEQILIESSKLNDDICESLSDLKIIQYFSIDDAKNSATVQSECASVFQGNVNENTNDNSGHSYEALVENSIVVKEKCGMKRGKLSQTNPDKIVTKEKSVEAIVNKETETIKKRRGRPPKLRNSQKEVMSNNNNPNMKQILIESSNSKLNTEGISDLEIIQCFSIDDAKSSTIVESECTSVFQENVNKNTNDDNEYSYEALVENSTLGKKKRGIKVRRRKPYAFRPNDVILLQNKISNHDSNFNFEDLNEGLADNSSVVKKKLGRVKSQSLESKPTKLSQEKSNTNYNNSEGKFNNDTKNATVFKKKFRRKRGWWRSRTFKYKMTQCSLAGSNIYNDSERKLNSDKNLQDHGTKEIESEVSKVTGGNNHHNMVSILTGDLRHDKTILKNDFLKCYNEVFDVNVENIIARLGDTLQQTMKELEPSSIIETLDAGNKDHICGFRNTFSALFDEVLNLIFSNTKISFQHKALIMVLFIKIFLRVITISPEFLESLLTAKNTMHFLLKDYLSSVSESINTLLHQFFHENDIDFERNCWLILEFCLTALPENEDC